MWEAVWQGKWREWMQSPKKKRWYCEEPNKIQAGEIIERAVCKPVSLHDIAHQMLLKLTTDYSKSRRYIFLKLCNNNWRNNEKFPILHISQTQDI